MRAACLALLTAAAAGCYDQTFTEPGPDPGPGPGSGSGSGSGSPKAQVMSDVHLQPDGNVAWMIHHQDNGHGVETTHVGVYSPTANTFTEVMDTTGTLGKKILFPAPDRVLLVAGSTAPSATASPVDVLVLFDTTLQKPIAERAYPGDLSDFQLAPSGKLLVATDAVDGRLHLIDTATLAEVALPHAIPATDAKFAHGSDVLYVLYQVSASTELRAFDLTGVTVATSTIAEPALVATRPIGERLAISDDDTTVAIANLSTSIDTVKVATGAARAIPSFQSCFLGDCAPKFTRDGRLIAWTQGASQKLAMHLHDANTGADTITPLVTAFTETPTAIVLQQHATIILDPALDTALPVDFDLATGTTAVQIPTALRASSRFERPGHAELWFENGDLSRLDLATGAITTFAGNVDSADYRAAADQIVVGTSNSHAIVRYSMIDGTTIGHPCVLADPNTVSAPYKLQSQL